MPMDRRRFVAGGLLAGSAWLGLLGREAGAQRPVRALLVVLGSPGHDIEKSVPHLERILPRIEGLQVTKWAPPPGMRTDAAHLARLAEIRPGDYDVLVFYTIGQQLNSEQERAIRRFVEEGGGLVALHGASASFGNSEVWFRLVGARFAGHAPGTYTLPMTVVDRDHPVTRGVSDFEIVDEEYTHRFAEGVERHVLVRFKQRPDNTVEKNGNNDAVWTIRAGRGRVVYNCLGHDEQAWQNPHWQKLVLQSIFWAAGRPREVRL